MIFILDTNVCIYIIKKQPKSVLNRLFRLKPDQLAISSVTWFELCYGVEKSEFREKNQRALRHFIHPFEILPWGKQEAEVAGQIRFQLQKSGAQVGAYDLLIAAQAMARQATLVTNNEKEFKRIEALKVENWV